MVIIPVMEVMVATDTTITMIITAILVTVTILVITMITTERLRRVIGDAEDPIITITTGLSRAQIQRLAIGAIITGRRTDMTTGMTAIGRDAMTTVTALPKTEAIGRATSNVTSRRLRLYLEASRPALFRHRNFQMGLIVRGQDSVRRKIIHNPTAAIGKLVITRRLSPVRRS
jgi:hypothetical protein